MGDLKKITPVVAGHGATMLPHVEVVSYNLEIKNDEGFIGDRASKGAFDAILDKWRKISSKADKDPFGDISTADLSKKDLDKFLAEGPPEGAAVVVSAIDDFARELDWVIRRFLKAPSWRDTEAIVFGGGFRASRVGELALYRTGLLLGSDGIHIHFHLIRDDPDEAGLLGTVHLMPAWILKGFDGFLAVDIGGSNIRVGVVVPNFKKTPDLSKSSVWKSELWRHRDDKAKRNEAVNRLVEMLEDMIAAAKTEKLELAPIIAIGCPGLIGEDGSIQTGAQNLPGNWESSGFNLPDLLREAIPKIGKHDTIIVMHNDAVVQGLSELHAMRRFENWGALTVGTGLGNARYANLDPRSEKTK